MIKETLLTEKEAIWAEMLMNVLKENGIPCASVPVYGAGFVIKTGTPERLKIYVTDRDLPKASELLDALFPEAEDK